MQNKKKRQLEKQHNHLSSHYRGIGIKAVAAAVEPGRKETDLEKDSPGKERSAITKKAKGE